MGEKVQGLTAQTTGLSPIGQEADEVAFTEGPWQVRGTRHDGWIEIFAVDDTGSGFLVGTVGNPYLRDGENAANARFIAAAPDMYRALALVEDLLDSNLTRKAHAIVVAALRKAEGAAE